MEKLQELIDKHGRWSDLKLQITTLSYEIDAGMLEKAIGASKALLETICKTILDDEGEPYSATDNVNKLAKKTMRTLRLEHADSMNKFGNALVTAMHSLGELRNTLDGQAHGQSLQKETPKIDPISAYFLVQSTELIACLLISVCEENRPLQVKSKPQGTEEGKSIYEAIDLSEFDNLQDFNEYLDDNYGDILLIDEHYPTSKALFLIDRIKYDAAYKDYLELDYEKTD